MTKKSEKVIFSKFLAILGHFWPFLRVFGHFLERLWLDLAENAYLSRTDHYLQLFYWHQGPKRSSSTHFWSFWVILGGQKLGGHGFRPFSRVWRLRIDWNCIERLGSNLYSNFRQIWGVLRGSSSLQGVSRDPWGPKISKNSKFSKKIYIFFELSHSAAFWVVKIPIEVGHPNLFFILFLFLKVLTVFLFSFFLSFFFEATSLF